MRKISLIFSVFILFTSATLHAQNNPASKNPPPGKDLMWKQPPSAPQILDLFWGPGSESQKPFGPFTFVEEDPVGTNPKMFVTDKNGVRWGVKFGDEAQAEVAASRFFYAAGYPTNEVYYVPSGTIQGAEKSLVSAKYLDKSTGAFKGARFKRNIQVPNAASVMDYFRAWDWDESPFDKTKELSGLLLLNALIANFDTKSNNNLVRSIKYNDGTVENWWIVGDIGGAFGKTTVGGHTKWDLKNYEKERLMRKSTDDSVKLFFEGRNAKHFQTIPMEHAKWFYSLVGNLTRSQIEDAFRSALSDVRTAPLPNSQDEALVQGFSNAFERRLAELRDAVQNNQAMNR